jgi:hypothetical protein
LRGDGFLEFEQRFELGLFEFAVFFAACLRKKPRCALPASGSLRVSLQRDFVFARQLLDTAFEAADTAR